LSAAYLTANQIVIVVMFRFIKSWHGNSYRISINNKTGYFTMERKCNKHLKEALNLARSLIILADDGERDSEDDSCSLLYGIVRDCAYRIKTDAECEVAKHRTSGRWP
jgi:hypothetical protein